MVDLFLVRVRFRVGLADTLGDDTGITLGVAGVFAVLALHAGRIFEEVAAKSTAHDVVKLLLDELVPIHLVHIFFPLSNSTLSAKTKIELLTFLGLLDEIHAQLDLSSGLEVEPALDWL